ncbi:MAG: PDZ domain-containing protein [Bacteroidales bacterium]|jgi:carboxyl-terminal processing protease|nr:PDZ domain-containing protein [Bacteroidales bacterium]
MRVSKLYRKFWSSLVVILLLNGVVIAQTYPGGNRSSTDKTNDYFMQSQKLNRVMQMIYYQYVDTVNIGKILEKGIVEMLTTLDPHSAYIPVKDVQRSNEPLQGNFEGIGISFQVIKDTITVIQPIKGGPSEKIGIQTGDKIVFIGDTVATGKHCTNDWVAYKLRGAKGTKVIVKIKRANIPDLLAFTIIRDKIPIYSIESYFMIDKETGYLQLDRFSQTTVEEFETAIRKLKSEGMKNLIFDLRGNSGGFLHAAVELADQFLSDEKLVVYTQNNQDKNRVDYNTKEEGIFEKGKLVVLIDEYSASASEIVSGAVQDWDRGIIIGRRSFGKGLVQSQFPLQDGSLVRLTTSRYYIPSGRCIQKPYEGVEDYSRDLINRYNSGQLTHADSVHFPDSLKFYTNNKRVVYGGGGIMPDIFVPMDTTRMTNFYWKLYRNNIFNRFALEYADREKQNILQKYPDFEVFAEKFKFTPATWEEFYEFAKKEGVTDSITFDFKAYLNAFIKENGDSLNKVIVSYDTLKDTDKLQQWLTDFIGKSIQKTENESQNFDNQLHIERQIKTLLARNLYDNRKAAKIWLQTDDTYQKAIEVIHNDALFKKMKIQNN